MKPDLKIVPIRDNAPLVNDIPGQLLQLAVDIERGEVAADQILLIVDTSDRILRYAFGGDGDRRQMIALCEAAKRIFLSEWIGLEPE